MSGPRGAVPMLKHSARHCTVCRDYKRHDKAKPPLGNWVALLGTIHWKRRRSSRRTACGRLQPGTVVRMLIWTLMAGEATCRSCRSVAASDRRRLRKRAAAEMIAVLRRQSETRRPPRSVRRPKKAPRQSAPN